MFWCAALICQTLHSLLGDPKHPRKIADFLPRLPDQVDQVETQDPAEQIARFDAHTRPAHRG